MNNEIVLDGERISLSLKVSKRARYVRITLHKNGNVVVTRPYGTDENVARDFLYKRAVWVKKHLKKFSRLNPLIPHYTRTDIEREKGALLIKINERLAHYNKYYNFQYNSVGIRNSKTRWGSCSLKRNLHFSFKMNYLPLHLFDYVIVHELCHLKEFNHGPRFWKLVEESLPHSKELRKELRLVA